MMFWIFLKLNPVELNIEEVNLHLLIRQAIDLAIKQNKKTLI
jgi:hypothetical protein